MLGVATEPASLKLILTFDFHIGHDYSPHLLLYVNSRYRVRHEFPPGGSEERARRYL